MKNSIILDNMSSEQILALFDDLQKEIQGLKLNLHPNLQNELMTREEVVALLKVDLSTLHNWTVKGKLVKYCLGNRVYYKRSEIDAALIAISHKK